MSEYASILNVFRRDLATNKLVLHDYAHPDFETLATAPWIASEKYDGMNMRLIMKDGEFSVRGRTDRASIPPMLFEHCMALEDSVRSIGDNCVLYGEGVGPKIQRGGYGTEQHFVLFDVKINYWWMEPHSVTEIADILNIPCTDFTAPHTLETMVEFALAGPVWTRSDGTIGEGIVARPLGGLLHRNARPIRVKIKERDFAPLRNQEET